MTVAVRNKAWGEGRGARGRVEWRDEGLRDERTDITGRLGLGYMDGWMEY